MVFSADQGNLIESPTKLPEGGIQFKGMLDPSIRVGCVVKVESRRITGFYKVASVSFQGDNYGGDYSVTIKGFKYA